MALINEIKCDIVDGEFCYKFPSDDLKQGSQQIVYPSQTTFFVKGGEIQDAFTSDTWRKGKRHLCALSIFVYPNEQ